MLAAYLVGSRGRVVDAIWLGLIVGITHTFTVIALAVIIKVAYSAIMTAVVQPVSPDAEPVAVPGAKIMQLVAGVLIMVVGIWLIVGRRRILTHEHEHDHHHNSHGNRHHQGIWHMLLLGISGGMVPCAEGIALLLAAVAAGQMGRGLTLVIAFSLGVTLVIVTIGIIVSKLTSLAENLLQRTGRWTTKLPIISGSVISLLGCYSIIKVLASL